MNIIKIISYFVVLSVLVLSAGLSFSLPEKEITNKTAAELFPLNQFKKMLGLKLNEFPPYTEMSPIPEELKQTEALPSSWDWRNQGIITSIKNQGPCGSCWAFSAVGVFESLIKKRDGVTADLSEQQLVNCDTSSFGCDGGWPASAMRYMKNSGIVYEKNYPYKAVKGTCNVKAKANYFIDKYWDVNVWNSSLANRINTFKTAIYNHGPVAAGFTIYADFYYNYRGGVYIYDGSSSEVGGHAIAIVGWVDNSSITNGGYWICKNSWGPAWGENGYFRIGYGQALIDRWILTYARYTSSPNNSPPIFTKTIGTITIKETHLASFRATATDPDGDKVTYSAQPLPNGANFDNTTGQFTWLTNYTSAGTYNITVYASDGMASTSQVVKLIVENVNRAPGFNTTIGTVNGIEGQKMEFYITAADPDIDDILVYSGSGLPSGSSLDSSTGYFSWTPSYTSAGTYTTIFTVSDGTVTISQTVIIQVKNYKRVSK